MGTGDDFQNRTKYFRGELGGGMKTSGRSTPYKTYKEPIVRIKLPEPAIKGGAGLWDTLATRRSERKFSARDISLRELAQLLWAINGITLRGRDYEFRTSPSAGALYPVETYFVANRVGDLEPGVYHHDISHWCVELLDEGDFGGNVATAALGQKMCEQAALDFIWTAIPDRSKWKYRDRAYRYIYLDAGHIGENLQLAVTAMGLGCCTIGAFFDDEINKIIDVDGVSETVIYLAAVGRV